VDSADAFITFRMWHGDRLWTLGQLVSVLGTRAETSLFTIVDSLDLELAGSESSTEILAWAKRGSRISAERMRRVGEGVQVVDGEIQGYEPDAATPWIRLRGVDSTYWDVATDDQNVLAHLRNTMQEVDDQT
jgi:hypothetical protein